MLNDQDAFAKRMSSWQQKMNPDGSVGTTKGKKRKKKRSTIAMVPKESNYASRDTNNAVVINNSSKTETDGVLDKIEENPGPDV